MPIGCSVPKVPVGWKTPSASTVPSSALNSVSAFGLAIENACCASAGMNVADGFVSVMTAVDSSCASQLWKRLSSGAPLSGSVFGEPAEHDLPVVGGARVLERAGEVVPAVEVEADRLGVERLPVVERHALAELERPDGAVRVRLPALGEPRHGLGRARLQEDERLEELGDGADRLTVRNERAVEHDRVGRAGEDERPARRRLATSVSVAPVGRLSPSPSSSAAARGDPESEQEGGE